MKLHSDLFVLTYMRMLRLLYTQYFFIRATMKFILVWFLVFA